MANDIVTIKGRSNDTLEIILSEGVSYRKLRDSLLMKLNKNRSFFQWRKSKGNHQRQENSQSAAGRYKEYTFDGLCSGRCAI